MQTDANGRRGLCGRMMLGVVLAYSTTSNAAVFEWTNPSSGNYIDAANWTLINGTGTAPPDAGDTARFTQAGSYEVRFIIDEASGALDMNLGDVTLRSFGPNRDYTLSGDVDIDNASLTLGAASDPLDLFADARFDVTNGSVNVRHGSLLRLTHFQGPNIGLGGNGFITVENSGSRLEVTDDMDLGSAGWLGTLTLQDSATGDIEDVLRLASAATNAVTGRVNVFSGAVLETGDIEIAAPLTTGGPNLDGRIDIDGAGSTLTMTGTSTLKIGKAGEAGHLAEVEVSNNGAFTSGTGAVTIGQAGTLEVLSDGVFNANGDVSMSTGATIHIDGGTLNANAGLDTTTGSLDFRNGVLAVTNGALTPVGPTDNFTLDGFAASDTVRLDVGAGATFDVGGDLLVGGGTGAALASRLDALDGGRLDVAGTTRVVSDGFLMAHDNGEVHFAGDVTLDGGWLSNNNFGSSSDADKMTFAPGTTLTIQNGGLFSELVSRTFSGVTINVNGSGSALSGGNATFDGDLNVTNDASVLMDVSFLVADGADAAASFDGDGTSLSAEFVSIGRFGHTGTLTFRDDAGGTIHDNGTLWIAESAAAGTTGHVHIESGAFLTARNVSIASAGGATTQGTLTVTGQGSEFVHNGTGAFTVGHASQGTATIDIEDGGVVETGPGLFTINRTGTVNVGVTGGGGLRLFGDLTIDDGTLSVGDSLAGLGIWADDLTITANGNAQLDMGFGLLVQRNATVVLEDSADLVVNNNLTLGQSQQSGTLNIDGDFFTGVTVDTGTLTVGGNQGTGVMDLRDGTVTASITQVAAGTGPNTNGSLDIRFGGELVAGGVGLDIATLAGATTQGVLRVHFGGKLSVPSFDGIDIGHASLGSATLEVRSGGEVSTSGTANTVRNTGTFMIAGAVTADGALNIDGGRVDLDGFSARLAAGSITLSNGGTFNFERGELAVGTFTGDLTSVAGSLAPGGTGGSDTYGVTTILGNYTQQDGAALDIELSGESAILEYDLVSIAGTAILDGELNLQLIDFIPDPADTFTVLGSAGGIVGVFDNVTTGQRLDTLDGGGSFQVHYGFGSAFAANEIVLSDFLVNAIAGDYNASGQVEQGDLDLVLQNWGATAVPGTWVNFTGLPGGNIGGLVEQTELDLVLSNWGDSATPDFRWSAIPEPGTALLIACGLAMFGRNQTLSA